MIVCINRLKQFGIFSDFNGTKIQKFGRYNLVYGWNGTGKSRVSEILCNRLMSDTVAENWRHHEQDAPHHYRRTAGSASGQLS
ncbi:AAA family ATPase, partial [Pseudomonas aeruginosa]|nr:AAA family ATPase [Pseudomonas aeruginosa]